MKTLTLLLLLVFGLSVYLPGQSVPQGMNYQAVLRDQNGELLADQEIELQAVLLGGGPEGKIVYKELHEVRTNHLGLFNLTIGRGDLLQGDFTLVPWSSEEIWLEILLDKDKKGDFSKISTTRLLAVPYAFHAATAGELVGTDLNAKIASAFWKTNGNAGVFAPYQFLGTLDPNDLVFKTNNQQRMTILGGNGEVQITYDLVVGGNVTANAFFGDGSGLTGINSNDADADPTNELQDWNSLPGIPADIADGDQVNDADADPTNELQDWNSLPGIPADIADGDQVDDADADPTNELQDWNNLPGIPADIADGDQVNDADADPTNELQDWNSLPGIPADIADGDQVDDADADPTNELQDWNNLPGIPADIVDGDQVNDADADPTNELQDWNSLPGIPADIADGDQVDDADADPTNELQDWNSLPGIPADIADGDQVNDADADPTNELELPPNPQLGDMLFYNGTAWEKLSPGTTGQVLTLNNGVPQWATPGAVPVQYEIGDMYEGAIIFYLDESGMHGLAAAPQDLPDSQWGCIDVLIANEGQALNYGAVGYGYRNTQIIVNSSCGMSDGILSAAERSVQYQLGQGVEWFLPTLSELELMYSNLHAQGLGNFVNGKYWSSFEFTFVGTYNYAYALDFTNGQADYQLDGNKHLFYHVRPIRAF